MTFPEFVSAVDKLVLQWLADEGSERFVPREQLQEIYQRVREQSVYDLAEAIHQRDLAVARLHDKYLEDGDKAKRKGKPKHDRIKPANGTAAQSVPDPAQ